MTSQARRHIKTIVAENIQAARAAKGFTQQQLAVELEQHPINVSRWERGVVMPNMDNLHKLADALERDASWFYVDHENGVAA